MHNLSLVSDEDPVRDIHVIQSLLFFTYVHERVFHLYTRAILALKFEADKECFNLRRQRSCQTL